jgi:DNA-binding transcriptional ArsR family regulator
MEETIVIGALAALAQPLRLQLFRALVVAGPRGMTPGTMAGGLGISPSSLSFHLKELMNAGLVTQERASRNLIYRAAYAQMNAVLGYLTENCCQGGACAIESAHAGTSPMTAAGRAAPQPTTTASTARRPAPRGRRPEPASGVRHA